MTTEEMSLYAQMVTQITDSIDALTVAVKELREDLHIVQEHTQSLSQLRSIRDDLDYIAAQSKA